MLNPAKVKAESRAEGGRNSMESEVLDLPRTADKPRMHRNLSDMLVGISILGDTLMIFLGLILGFWIRFRSGWITFGVESSVRDFSAYFGLFIIGAVFLLLTFSFLRLYEASNLLRFRRVAQILLKGTAFWVVAYLGTSLVLKFDPAISRIYAASSFLACLLTLTTWRWIFHFLLEQEAVAKRLRQRLLVAGWSDDVHRLLGAMQQDRTQPYTLVGVIATSSDESQVYPNTIKWLGTYGDLPRLLSQNVTDILLVANLNLSMEDIINLSNLCEKEFVQFKNIPSYYQILVSGLKLETISGVPILGVSELPLDRLSNRILKRAVDIVGALVGLTIAAPIILICGILVYRESHGPIFYRQIRTGRNGVAFAIIKLRSMRIDAEQNGAQWAQKNDPRRLRIGAIMREWNLDEVPQFWNVLKGEMSLVGPRPERPELINTFKETIPHYNARHNSKPGITGWAQINGFRGDTSLVDRIRCDLFYLENWNLWLDFQIMIQTFFKRDNAY